VLPGAHLSGRIDHNGDGVSGAVSESFEHDAVGRVSSYGVPARLRLQLLRPQRLYSGGNGDPTGALADDWSPAVNAGSDRGFTGHEHLDDLGLIHMNGRLYDPKLARFVQADPNITLPGELQSYDARVESFFL
jgi:RHS repeat-associated protein